MNREFVTYAFTDNGVYTATIRSLAIITGAGIIGYPGWAVVDGWLEAYRDNRH